MFEDMLNDPPEDFTNEVRIALEGAKPPEGMAQGLPEDVARIVRESLAGLGDGLRDWLNGQLRDLVSFTPVKPSNPATQSQADRPTEPVDPSQPGPPSPRPEQPAKPLPVARRAEQRPDQAQPNQLLDTVIDIREILQAQLDRQLQPPMRPDQQPQQPGQQPEQPQGRPGKPSNPFVEKLQNTRLGRIATRFKDRIQNAWQRNKPGSRQQQTQGQQQPSKVQDLARQQRDKQLNRLTRGNQSDAVSRSAKLPNRAGTQIPNSGAVRGGLNTAALRGGSSGVTSAARLAGGTGGAGVFGTGGAGAGAATGSLSAGGAGAAGGAAAGAGAVLGPLAIVAAAAVAAGYAFYEVMEAGYDLAYQQEQQARALAYAAPQIAAAVAQLDANRMRRDIERGANTAASFTALMDSINDLEQSVRPIKDLLSNVSNFAGAVTVQMLADAVKKVEEIASGVADVKVLGADAFPLLKMASDYLRELSGNNQPGFESLQTATFARVEEVRRQDAARAQIQQNAARGAHG